MGISKTYRGTAVSEGYGIGNAVVIKDEKLDYSDVAFTTPEMSVNVLMTRLAVTPKKQKPLLRR